MRNSVLLLALLTAIACDSASETQLMQQRIEQCRQVIAFWAAPHRDMQHSTEYRDGIVRVKVSMTMQAVLAELPGSGSCDYAVGNPKAAADKPLQITIGNTGYRSDQDIADLLSLRKESAVIDHQH